MAKKIKIQHLYTTGSTIENGIKTPTGLDLGEIAIDASSGFEDIKIINEDGEIVSATNYHASKTANVKNYEHADNFNVNSLGHVRVYKGDLSNINRTHEDLPYAAHILHNHDSKYAPLSSVTAFNEFLTSTGLSGVVDTLYEIKEVLNGEASGITGLTTTVKNIKENYFSGIELDNPLSSTTTTSGTTIIGHRKIYNKPESGYSISIKEVFSEEKTGGPAPILTGLSLNTITGVTVDKFGHTQFINTGSTTIPMAMVEKSETGARFLNNIGVVSLQCGDLSGFGENYTLDYLRGAASIYHYHSQYVKLSDLSDDTNSDTITISCGTY